jgi:hypothetical protein
MAWSIIASWANALGALVLTFGTGAQAWTNLAEYRDVLGSIRSGVREGFVDQFPRADLSVWGGRTLPAWITRIAKSSILVSDAWDLITDPIPLVLFIGSVAARVLPKTTARLLQDTDAKADEEEAKELARIVAIWFILMIGAMLVLAGTVIQLVLGYVESLSSYMLSFGGFG